MLKGNKNNIEVKSKLMLKFLVKLVSNLISNHSILLNQTNFTKILLRPSFKKIDLTCRFKTTNNDSLLKKDGCESFSLL